MHATGLIAVAFIALGQHFSESVVAYDKEDFTLATKSFTTVIDTAHRDSPYTEIALLWRSRARGSRKRSVAEERDLDRLLQRDLGAEDYAVRREAERQLRAAGPKARDLLEEATKHDDPEIAFQAQALLDAFK
jgi:hypothetical protein